MPATDTNTSSLMPSILSLDTALNTLGLEVRMIQRSMYNLISAHLAGEEFVAVTVLGRTVSVNRGVNGAILDQELAAKISNEINKFGYSTFPCA